MTQPGGNGTGFRGQGSVTVRVMVLSVSLTPVPPDDGVGVGGAEDVEFAAVIGDRGELLLSEDETVVIAPVVNGEYVYSGYG